MPKQVKIPKKKIRVNPMARLRNVQTNLPSTSLPLTSDQIKTPSLKENSAKKYLAALTAPFSEEAAGAQVIDQYANPTSTLLWKDDFTLTCDSAGSLDAIIFPNLMLPVVSPRGSISAGASGPWITDGNSTAFGIVYNNPNALYTKLTNYRIVGYGLRIRGVASMTNSSGMCTVAHYPVESYAYSDNLNTVGSQTSNLPVTRQECFQAWGLPYSGTGSGAYIDVPGLVRAPTFAQFPCQQLCEKQMEFHPKIISARAFDFRQSKDSDLGFNMTTQSSAFVANSGTVDHYRSDGFQSLVIGLTGGVPFQTSLSCTVIYHLEGNPNTSDSPFVQESSSVAADPLEFLKVLHKAVGSPSVTEVIQTGVSLASKALAFL